MKRNRTPTRPYQNLLKRYPDTPLADIPWMELPPPLQAACWQIIHDWRSESGMDLDITLSELLVHQDEIERARTSKRYRLVAYIRVDVEHEEPMSYDEAMAEKAQQEFLFPENVYRIEEIESPAPVHRKEEDLCIPPESRRS